MISQGGGWEWGEIEITTYQHLKTGNEAAIIRITNTFQT
jgi:hypothetical protein